MTQHGLSGKVAIIGGSSRGIGAAVAQLLSSYGVSVVVNGRAPEPVAEVVEQITNAGGNAVGVVGSGADKAVAQEMVATAIDRFGRLDIAINCAGVGEPSGSNILNITDEDFAAQLDAHVGTTFQLIRAAAPVFVEQGSGVFVTTSSFAFTGEYGGSGYPAGKGAVNSLTYAVAAELKEHGIRANVVCPGARTRLSTGEDYEEQIKTLNERGLLSDLSRHGALDVAGPEYVASLYAFLASDLASEVSGHVLVSSGCYLGHFAKPVNEFITWQDHHARGPLSLDEVAAQLASVTADSTAE